MGLLQDTIKKLRAKKQVEKTRNQEEIEEYIETEKFKQNLEKIKQYERESFLYGQ